ncbi:hypothetical protein K492DRAFT_196907 [Lichtheimia hyalospora FSU 10163]|nr:hypothetical protein K492DRAFT_196907 [Lichtheimia hyalospora FSU 10163]
MARYFKWMNGPHIRHITLRNQSKHDTEQLFQLLIECHYHHPIQVLDLYECDIPLDYFVQLLHKLGRSLVSLVLSGTNLTLAMVLYLLRMCPDLELFQYQVGNRYAAPPIPVELDDRALPDMLPKLRRLVLSNGGVQPPLQMLLRHCPSSLEFLWLDPDDFQHDRSRPFHLLETLDVTTFYYTSTATTDISSKQRVYQEDDHDINEDFLVTKDHIHNLQCRMIPGIIIQSRGWLNDRMLLPILNKKQYPLIQTLSLGQCPQVTSDSLCKLLSTHIQVSLTHLELDKADMIKTIHLIALIKQSSELLHTVRLRRMKSVTNGVVDALSDTSRLEHVDLSYCNSISDDALKRFIDKQGQWIKTLDTVGCKAITFDAINYCWRRMGFG